MAHRFTEGCPFCGRTENCPYLRGGDCPDAPGPHEEVEEDLRHHACDRSESWIARDGRGIPIGRVCAKCVDAKLARFRPEILRPYGPGDVDERIEPLD